MPLSVAVDCVGNQLPQNSATFEYRLQIRNEAEVLSVRAKHEKAATDEGFWIGHEALWGSRTGSSPAALLLLV